MLITNIRQKLHQFIDIIEDEKIEAMYTLFKEEIEKDESAFPEEILSEISHRYEQLESEQVKGYTWEEVKQKARQSTSEGK